MNNSKEVVQLLYKYIREELTGEESATLQNWVQQSDENRLFFEEATNTYKLLAESRAKIKNSEEIDLTRAWQRLKALGLPAVPFEEKKRTKLIAIRWLKYAAAVIVLMIGSVTFYLLILKKHENKIINEPAVAKANNDVPPGKYRAKLTLADGSFIVLDSVMVGKLAQQGGTQVTNNDGKLIYAGQGINGKEVLYNTLATSRGQMYPLVLSDNSRIWLNSESSIKYPVAFAGNERRVQITGEVYFEIAHDASRPFIVSVNGTEIKVLGTKFNVNAYANEDQIRTTLLEGSVQIRKGIQYTTIKPGQQAQVADNEIKTINDVDVDESVAWRFGYFQFSGADLPSVMRQLERWYDVQTAYEGKVPQHKFLGKVPRNMNLSQVLDLLDAQGVKFKIEGKKIIVSPE